MNHYNWYVNCNKEIVNILTAFKLNKVVIVANELMDFEARVSDPSYVITLYGYASM